MKTDRQGRNGMPSGTGYVYRGSQPWTGPAGAELPENGRRGAATVAMIELNRAAARDRRARYLALIDAGTPRDQAAAAVGVTPKTGQKYERERRTGGDR